MDKVELNDPKFLKLWNRIDLDNNGYLDRREFNLFMESYYLSIGWSVSPTAMDECF